MTMTTVAALNSVYRLLVVAVLFPLYRQLEAISKWLIRSRNEKTVDDLKPLEERFIGHPSLAVEQSRQAINDMAVKAKENLLTAFGLLHSYSQENFERVQLLENTVDRYEDRLGTYLLKITSNELNEDQNESTGKFLRSITDFERISDHAVNLAETAQEIHQKDIIFSADAEQELRVVESALTEIVTMTFDAFLKNDIELATRVEPLEDLIDNLCRELKLHHVKRLKNGKCSLNTGFVFNDILNNYERIADHCSNIAASMITLESDTFDRHEYLDSIKRMKSETYEEYFKVYSKKYIINN